MRNTNLSHKSNLIQKKRRLEGKKNELADMLSMVVRSYAAYLKSANWAAVKQGDLSDAVESLNKYLDIVKDIESTDAFFNWRSDFAGSVVPEFLYRIFHIGLSELNVEHHFSTRASVVEMTLQSSQGQSWNVRRKNQDLCLGNAKTTTNAGGEDINFVIPSIIFEVKTNIDINKLNGLEFSAERLKRTFPSAKYFLVTETVDFSLTDNYASGSLDEIYCLRKQLRSASRRHKDPIQLDVVEKLYHDVLKIMERFNIAQVHVYDRLVTGKLIDV